MYREDPVVAHHLQGEEDCMKNVSCKKEMSHRTDFRTFLHIFVMQDLQISGTLLAVIQKLKFKLQHARIKSVCTLAG